jgi:hypothetical protein
VTMELTADDVGPAPGEITRRAVFTRGLVSAYRVPVGSWAWDGGGGIWSVRGVGTRGGQEGRLLGLAVSVWGVRGQPMP